MPITNRYVNNVTGNEIITPYQKNISFRTISGYPYFYYFKYVLRAVRAFSQEIYTKKNHSVNKPKQETF